MKPFDQVISDLPIARPVQDRRDRPQPAHRVRARPEPLGATSQCAAGCSTSTAWTTAATRTLVATEASKAGRVRHRPRLPARGPGNCQHKGPKWDDGRIRKELFETASPAHTAGPNLRRRSSIHAYGEAISLTYDFDTEQPLQPCTGGRTEHVQQSRNSFAEGKLPEARLLEPFRAELPPGGVPAQPTAPRGTGGEPARLRANLHSRARQLLEEPAGSSPPTAAAQRRARPRVRVPRPRRGAMAD